MILYSHNLAKTLFFMNKKRTCLHYQLAVVQNHFELNFSENYILKASFGVVFNQILFIHSHDIFNSYKSYCLLIYQRLPFTKIKI